MLKKYYIENYKTGATYNLNENKLQDYHDESIYDDNASDLQEMIDEDKDKFQDCIVKKYMTAEDDEYMENVRKLYFFLVTHNKNNDWGYSDIKVGDINDSDHFTFSITLTSFAFIDVPFYFSLILIINRSDDTLLTFHVLQKDLKPIFEMEARSLNLKPCK